MAHGLGAVKEMRLDAYAGYFALVPDGMNHSSQVPARIALRILLYYPGRSAAGLECPALFCVSYDVGHFDLYVGDALADVVADQITFLQAVVPVGPSSS